MSDKAWIKLSLFFFSVAMIFASNGTGYEIGHWNWCGLFGYLGGTAAGVGLVYNPIVRA